MKESIGEEQITRDFQNGVNSLCRFNITDGTFFFYRIHFNYSL